jgi:predicted PurR-regulated permease PerM
MMEPDAAESRRARRVEVAVVALAVVAGIAALRAAQEFFIPVVVGIFLAYALRPIVSKLVEWRIPEALAAAVVMAVLVCAIAGGAYAMRDQATSALADLPQAAHAIRLRLRALAGDGAPTPLAHVKAAAAELKRAANEVAGESTRPAPAASPGIVDRLTADGINALGVLTTFGVALVITLFLLAAGNSFRRKLLRVGGSTLRERRVTVEILDEIDVQVQRYLLVLLSTNVALGLVLWGVFTAFGLERAALFAFCVAVLHAVPYLGIVMALVVIAVVAILQFASVSAVLGILVATCAASIVIGLFLQNWLQGRASQMNPVAVFLSVIFFGWLWGGWGLLLGAPLVAIVRTIASRIESLAPLAEFLSDDVHGPAAPAAAQAAQAPRAR